MREANLRKLPAWYYRLVQITIDEDRDIEASDFDEDISELAVCDTCSKEEKSCECGDKQDAHEEDARVSSDRDEGDSSDEDAEDSDENDEDDEDNEDSDDDDSYGSEDAVSERSYDGSDAEYYYEPKDDREKRKRDLLKIRERAQKEKIEA